MGYEEYTHEQIEFLKEYYPDHSLKETHSKFCELFGEYTLSQVKHRIFKHKIKTKNVGKFEKGVIPWNKGLNVKEERPDLYERMKEFNKNGLNGRSNWYTPLPIGTEVKRDNTIVVKTEEGWMNKGRYVWEQHYKTKLSKEEVILHLNGNPYDCSIENLMLVNNKIIARLNKKSLITADAEITRSAVINAMLQQKIHEMEIKIKDEPSSCISKEKLCE